MITIEERVKSDNGAILERLTPIQEKIIMLRCGVAGDTGHTVKQICSEFGLSQQRIRKIEARAYVRLEAFYEGG